MAENAQASECTHDCSTCASACSERTEPQSFLEKPNRQSRIQKVIGVVSGKGGVGKSLVTSLLACRSAAEGHKTAILDADLTGPSIPKAFGISEKATADDDGLIPLTTKNGIKLMSLNLLLENETDPVVWRGPVIAGTVKQFWTDVNWGDVEYMYVDMPPGTGDVPLTVFQSIPLNGIVVVTTPQDLVSMIVEKAVKMARMMDIPVLGIVENMSYFECPDCKKKHFIFGESRLDEIAGKLGIPAAARLPLSPETAGKVDRGEVDTVQTDELESVIGQIRNA